MRLLPNSMTRWLELERFLTVAAYKNLDSWRFELADRLDSGLRR